MAEEKSGSLANSRLSNFHETICLPLLLVCSFHFNITSTHSLSHAGTETARTAHVDLPYAAAAVCWARTQWKSLTARIYTFLHFISAREYILARDMAKTVQWWWCVMLLCANAHITAKRVSSWTKKKRRKINIIFGQKWEFHSLHVVVLTERLAGERDFCTSYEFASNFVGWKLYHDVLRVTLKKMLIQFRLDMKS